MWLLIKSSLQQWNEIQTFLIISSEVCSNPLDLECSSPVSPRVNNLAPLSFPPPDIATISSVTRSLSIVCRVCTLFLQFVRQRGSDLEQVRHLLKAPLLRGEKGKFDTSRGRLQGVWGGGGEADVATTMASSPPSASLEHRRPASYYYSTEQTCVAVSSFVLSGAQRRHRFPPPPPPLFSHLSPFSLPCLALPPFLFLCKVGRPSSLCAEQGFLPKVTRRDARSAHTISQVLASRGSG